MARTLISSPSFIGTGLPSKLSRHGPSTLSPRKFATTKFRVRVSFNDISPFHSLNSSVDFQAMFTKAESLLSTRSLTPPLSWIPPSLMLLLRRGATQFFFFYRNEPSLVCSEPLASCDRTELEQTSARLDSARLIYTLRATESEETVDVEKQSREECNVDAEKDTPLVELIEEVPEEDKETDRLLERRVRCPCGTLTKTNFMIQREDPRCCCWQHTSCVLIPEEAVEAKPPVPDVFYCEICRLSRADPLTAITHPLYPVKLDFVPISCLDGDIPSLAVQKTFQVTVAERELLKTKECLIQAWCMLLNDKVPFRMHWPLEAELHVNDNQHTNSGENTISLTGLDARSFVLGVRVVKCPTIEPGRVKGVKGSGYRRERKKWSDEEVLALTKGIDVYRVGC